MKRERYGIVVCPNCRYAKGVDLTTKFTDCPHCGKRLKIEKMKIYYRSASQDEISWAVGKLNAKIRGEEIPKREEKEKEDPYYRAVKRGEEGEGEREKLMIIMRELTSDLGEVDREDMEKIADLLGEEDVEGMIEKLRRLDEVYEPEEGVFRAVDT